MAWFFKKEKEIQESRLHSLLSSAFQKVKHDTTNIFSWISYFQNRHNEHDSRLAELEKQMYFMPKTREEIKHIIDSYYSFDSLKSRLDYINERIENLEKTRQVSYEKPAERVVERQVEYIEKPAQRTKVREQIIRKFVKNSKDYIKSTIFSIIRRYGEISASKLRDMVVDEQGLCSKSSFYRLLSELEKEEELGVVNSGKEKVYLLKNERYINQ